MNMEKPGSQKERTILHEELTAQIIAGFYAVYNTLGPGFLEKVFENALTFELQQRRMSVRQQIPVCVYYQGEVVGEYFADMLVNDLIIIEIKAVESIIKAHEYQLVNYLKATTMEVGLLLNFGPKADYRRKVFSNARKTGLKGVEPRPTGL